MLVRRCTCSRCLHPDVHTPDACFFKDQLQIEAVTVFEGLGHVQQHQVVRARAAVPQGHFGLCGSKSTTCRWTAT